MQTYFFFFFVFFWPPQLGREGNSKMQPHGIGVIGIAIFFSDIKLFCLFFLFLSIIHAANNKAAFLHCAQSKALGVTVQ